MLTVAILLLAIAVLNASAVSETEYQQSFVSFISKHKKAYQHDEFHVRYAVFKDNYDFVSAHDAEAAGFEVAINEFADMTNEEFKRMYNGYRGTNTPSGDVHEVSGVELPAEVDWRTKGAVTGVKNQGQCGSCWSFSTTGSTEGQHFLSKQGSLIGLSEQNLMDCSTAEGNMGCGGGLMDNAFRYIIKNDGIDTESSYPYTARDGTCHYEASNKGASITSYTDVTSGSESSLQDASANIGPISVAIDAGLQSFQFYNGGVYSDAQCSSTQLDHGVLVAGYGTYQGKAYWLVKNSWGPSWGLQGYIMMARNDGNMCGIATSASYPVIKK